MKPQTVQIVRQGEATPYWFKVNPLYFCPVPVLPISGIFIFAGDMAAGLVCFWVSFQPEASRYIVAVDDATNLCNSNYCFYFCGFAKLGKVMVQL